MVAMPFRASFSCLWCGRPWTTRATDDLEGWAQLCPDCLGTAGEDGFRRMRLRTALAERAASTPRAAVGPSESAATVEAPLRADDAEGLDAPPPADDAARAAEYDDWYLRRGRFAHGPIEDMAWTADLDAAGLWLDGLPLGGEIVELAAGTGWWSTLLAGKGELWCYDPEEAMLERARSRLVAHGLRAHLHVRDAWAEADRAVDALFCGFWLGHVQVARVGAFLALCRRWLKPGGRFAFIDSFAEATPGADGRESRIPIVHHAPGELEAALGAAGFNEVAVTSTARFFLLGTAVAVPSTP